MSGSDFEVGLVGFGLAGAAFHAPLISTTPGLHLKTAVTRDVQRRELARSRHPDVQLADSLTGLLEQGGHDLVVIATPNRLHAPLAREALDAGVSVVVDKPLAVSAAEAAQLVRQAATGEHLLSVFQNRRWDGDFLTISDLVASGALGQVWRLESRFERWVPTPKSGWRELPDPAEAGGVLFDLGAHLVDQVLLLFGPVATVYAELDQRRPGAQVTDDAFVALTHANGVRSHLSMSSTTAQRGPRFRLVGDAGGYTKYGLDVQEAALRSGDRPGGPDWGQESEHAWGLLGTDGDVRPVPTKAGAYPEYYERIVAALRGDAPVPVDAADAVHVLEVIESAQASADSGRAVELSADSSSS
ncbi:MAG: Gfo/Idh/MocA family oxidoreductase [Actinomycetes bacterium]